MKLEGFVGLDGQVSMFNMRGDVISKVVLYPHLFLVNPESRAIGIRLMSLNKRADVSADRALLDNKKKEKPIGFSFLKVGGRRGSNPRPSVPQTDALTN